MALSQETVDYVANLSRIALSPEELKKLSRQLEAVLEHIDRLNELDTADIPPTSHILPLQNVVRPDVPTASLPVDKALANAPDRRGAFFGVPKVIE